MGEYVYKCITRIYYNNHGICYVNANIGKETYKRSYVKENDSIHLSFNSRYFVSTVYYSLHLYVEKWANSGVIRALLMSQLAYVSR